MIASLTAENGQAHRRSVNSLLLREGRTPPLRLRPPAAPQEEPRAVPDMTNCTKTKKKHL